ncbi:hypothetical protein IFM89_004977 [Coptis chinensis]|uniref:Uncharacterized protein n=1 Tax=Coptis chinensis TaxID=261450 RepID=A0A835LYM5_9MAGN|nr:hypothetical protein IFM89_004977 [Coptis chinensis]
MTEMNIEVACIRVYNNHIIPVKCPEIAPKFLVNQNAKFVSRPITMGKESISHGFLSVITAPWVEQLNKMRGVVAYELLTPARLKWFHVNVRVASRAYYENELVYARVDNTPNAIEWVIAEMVNQLDIPHKSGSEIDNVVGKDTLVQGSDIPLMYYVKACVRETFQLHPVAPLTFHMCPLLTLDTTVASYFITKGSYILLSQIAPC